MAKRYPKAEINGKFYEIRINPDCVKLKKDICAPCAFYDMCGPVDDTKGFECNLVAGCYYKECKSSKVMPGQPE